MAKQMLFDIINRFAGTLVGKTTGRSRENDGQIRTIFG